MLSTTGAAASCLCLQTLHCRASRNARHPHTTTTMTTTRGRDYRLEVKGVLQPREMRLMFFVCSGEASIHSTRVASGRCKGKINTDCHARGRVWSSTGGAWTATRVIASTWTRTANPWRFPATLARLGQLGQASPWKPLPQDDQTWDWGWSLLSSLICLSVPPRWSEFAHQLQANHDNFNQVNLLKLASA